MPYLTPNYPSAPAFLWMIVPNTMTHIVYGAIMELAKSYNWEEFGQETVEEALAGVGSMLDTLYVGSTPLPSTVNSLDGFLIVDTPTGPQYVVMWGWWPILVNEVFT